MTDKSAQIAQFLNYTLPEAPIPELGRGKKGKVRDIYFSEENVVMVTNDRVSAFDFILPNLIPFKGQVLNGVSEHMMRETADIIPNALVGSGSLDPAVVVQKKLKNLNIECIVRGYMWGSMAAAYEKGARDICGIPLKDDLLRYQPLPEPLYTPTTKAEVGHDENMTAEEVDAFVGKELAAKAKALALKLYARGVEVMRKRGLILIDTKYEFGVTESGDLVLIDECNTPDSSRMVEVEEYEKKWPLIQEAMKSGSYKNVSELMKEKKELKMKEFSKQFVRDALLDMGFKPETATEAPRLNPEQIVECSKRYIEIYERITGKEFEFPANANESVGDRLVRNLKAHGVIKGCCCLIAAGSDSDIDHMNKLKDELAKFGVPAQLRVCSAHKQPGKLEATIKHYNNSLEPVALIGCAGGTDALSGTASFLATFPVVSCPPEGSKGQGNDSCLLNPPGSSNSYVRRPANAARHVAQIFAHVDANIKKALEDGIKAKVDKLAFFDDNL